MTLYLALSLWIFPNFDFCFKSSTDSDSNLQSLTLKELRPPLLQVFKCGFVVQVEILGAARKEVEEDGGNLAVSINSYAL